MQSFFKALLHFHIPSVQDASIVSSGASLVVHMVKNPCAIQESQVQSLGQEDPLEKRITTHSNILAWEFHGQSPRVTQLSPWLIASQYQMQFIFTAVSLGIPTSFLLNTSFTGPHQPKLPSLSSLAFLLSLISCAFLHLPPCCLFAFLGPCFFCLLSFTTVTRERKNDYSFTHILGEKHF